jgi:hypothetical protein
VFAFQDGEVVMKSTPVMVALAAIMLTSLALIESAEARRYRSVCGFPEYGTWRRILSVATMPRVSVLFPSWFTAPITPMSSGSIATSTVVGELGWVQ